MPPKSRNVFPFLAMLISAGIIAGLGGMFLLLSDQLGSSTDIISNVAAQNQKSIQTKTNKTLGSHTATVLSVAADVSGSWVASGSYDNTVKLWNRDNAEVVRSLAHRDRVNDLVFTADGQYLLTVSSSGDINLWSVSSTELTTSFPGNSDRIMSVAIDADNSRFAVGSSSGAIKTWALNDTLRSSSTDTPSSKRELPRAITLNTTGPQINTLAFHPANSNLLVSGDQAGTIRVWDIAQQRNTLTLEKSPERILSLSINNRGYIAASSADASIQIWNLENAQLNQTLTDHELVVADVAFNADGTLLASASYDETIKIWDWQKNEVLCTLRGHSGFVYSVAFSDTDDTLVSGGYDGTVRTWNLAAIENRECIN